MRTIKWSSAFKRDFRRELRGKHGKTLEADLRRLLALLESDAELPFSYRDHSLSGEWKNYRDCHVHPDLVLIYQKLDSGELQLLRLERLGSHAELFG